MANDNKNSLAHHSNEETYDHTFGTERSAMDRAPMDAPRATAPAAPINAPGITPGQDDTAPTPDTASNANNPSAAYTTSSSVADHRGSAVEVAPRYDRGLQVPFNREVKQHFENGSLGSDLVLHNQLVSWLKHHGFQIKKPNQIETVALVTDFLQNTPALPDLFYGKVDSLPASTTQLARQSLPPPRRRRPAKSQATKMPAASTPDHEVYKTAWYREVQDRLNPDQRRVLAEVLRKLLAKEMSPNVAISQALLIFGNEMADLRGFSVALPPGYQLVPGINGHDGIVRVITPDFMDEVLIQNLAGGGVEVELIARHQTDAPAFGPIPSQITPAMKDHLLEMGSSRTRGEAYRNYAANAFFPDPPVQGKLIASRLPIMADSVAGNFKKWKDKAGKMHFEPVTDAEDFDHGDGLHNPYDCSDCEEEGAQVEEDDDDEDDDEDMVEEEGLE